MDPYVGLLLTSGGEGINLGALHALNTWMDLGDMMDAIAALEVQQSWSAATAANADKARGTP